MKKGALLLAVVIIGIVLWGVGSNAESGKSDKQQIIDLEHGLIAATNNKNVDEMMSYYDGTDRLIIFDAVPPLKYSGTQAWRKNLDGFVAAYNPGILEITDLQIVNDAKIGYAHSIQRFTGTDKNGRKVRMAFRVTDCLEKENGKWKIVHEHNSMPIDYASGRAFLDEAS
ncbi:MAG TPA: nuclear transport factor 2 family protein [Candidatus Binataceae bacterium]|nr:nuclear transport factor 2 family protein [Candidatus Binataceae bacterium]